MYDDWRIDEPNLYAGGAGGPTYINGKNQNYTGKMSSDYVRFGGSRSTLHAGSGNDRIDVNGTGLVAYGDSGNDLIATYFGGSYSTLYGGIGNDTLYVNTEGVYADGEAGDDTFYVINSASEVTCDGGDSSGRAVKFLWRAATAQTLIASTRIISSDRITTTSSSPISRATTR